MFHKLDFSFRKLNNCNVIKQYGNNGVKTGL